MKTKKQILETARNLFNEKGYTKTTMRDISNAMNMTVGNLTYHFKKKHDLFYALMVDIELDSKIIKAESLLDFHLVIDELLDGMVRNRFFFSDFKLFDSIEGYVSPDVKGKEFLNLTVNLLNDLKSNGYFITEFDSDRMVSTMRICLLAHLTWISNGPDIQDKHAFLLDHWRLLMPYFTKKGWTCYYSEIEPRLKEI